MKDISPAAIWVALVGALTTFVAWIGKIHRAHVTQDQLRHVYDRIEDVRNRMATTQDVMNLRDEIKQVRSVLLKGKDDERIG